jgi:NADPH-dependent FMN reductase
MMEDVPEASLEDLEWADAYIFGTPTRFGNVSAQLKQFIDTLGGLWFKGKMFFEAARHFPSTFRWKFVYIVGFAPKHTLWPIRLAVLPGMFSVASRSSQGLPSNNPKGGDLDGKGLDRGTRRNSPLRSSGAGQKHPASPEYRCGSAPWLRYQGEVPDRSRGFFRQGFCCLGEDDLAYCVAVGIKAL